MDTAFIDDDYFRKKDLSWYEDYFYPELEEVVDRDMDFEIEPEPNIIEPSPTVNIEPSPAPSVPFEEEIILNCWDIPEPPKVDASQIFINQVSQPIDYTKILPKTSAEKPLKGKYKFIDFANVTITTSFNNIGVPLSSVLYNFKIGDVIDVQEMYFNDKGDGWEAGLSVITEQNRAVPFSLLTKVPDSTPITENISRTEENKTSAEKPYIYQDEENSGEPRPNNDINTSQANITNKSVNDNSTIAYAGLGLVAICIGILIFKK